MSKKISNSKLDEDDLDLIKDLMFESNLSFSAIAKELDISLSALNKAVNQLGLNWLKKSKRKMSRGQTALTDILKKLLPSEEIINEYHVGERLMLDVYCPSYKLGVEYHGRQHFYYTGRFFESRYDFVEAQKRDEKKIELCKENGITLVVFRYNDSLTEQSVYDRILDAIRNSTIETSSDKGKTVRSITSSEYYQKMKKKNSEYRKAYYKKMKERKFDN